MDGALLYSSHDPARLETVLSRSGMRATCSCLVSRSATVSSRVLVGFSEHTTTRRTLRSPRSRRPLDSAPTRTTLRRRRDSEPLSPLGFLKPMTAEFYTASQKNCDTLTVAMTLSTLDCLAKFFHYCKEG